MSNAKYFFRTIFQNSKAYRHVCLQNKMKYCSVNVEQLNVERYEDKIKRRNREMWNEKEMESYRQQLKEKADKQQQKQEQKVKQQDTVPGKK